MNAPQGIHRVGRAAALDLERAHADALGAVARAAGTSPGGARGPGRGSAGLCGGVCAGISTHALEAELRARVARDREMAEVRRVERPAEDAQRAQLAGGPARLSARTWPSPSTRYLNVHSSRSADRAARVQLLRRVADLGAHPELAAVGEARRGVDVHAGGVDAELEGARAAVSRVTIASECPLP